MISLAEAHLIAHDLAQATNTGEETLGHGNRAGEREHGVLGVQALTASE
jgi:hypothetical protein